MTKPPWTITEWMDVFVLWSESEQTIVGYIGKREDAEKIVELMNECGMEETVKNGVGQ